MKTRVYGGCSVSRAQTALLRSILFYICLKLVRISLTAAELTQSVGRMTAERKVLGSIRGAGPTLVVLKSLRHDGTSFALHVTRPSRGSDDRVKCRTRFQLELLNKVFPIGTFELNTSTLEPSAFCGVPGLW